MDNVTPGFLILGIIAIMYFVPAIVAGMRHHPQALAIFMLDFFLGWSVLGWVIALVWACTNPPSAPAVIVNNNSPPDPRT